MTHELRQIRPRCSRGSAIWVEGTAAVCVDQASRAPARPRMASRKPTIGLHVVQGGVSWSDRDWRLAPDRDAVFVGTIDMLTTPEDINRITVLRQQLQRLRPADTRARARARARAARATYQLLSTH